MFLSVISKTMLVVVIVYMNVCICIYMMYVYVICYRFFDAIHQSSLIQIQQVPFDYCPSSSSDVIPSVNTVFQDVQIFRIELSKGYK